MENNITKNIKSILRKIDLFNLIEEGAPKNEYDLEIPKMIELLNRSSSSKELFGELYNFYRHHFIKELIIEEKMVRLAEELFKLK